jgi:hypothetical protein
MHDLWVKTRKPVAVPSTPLFSANTVVHLSVGC